MVHQSSLTSRLFRVVLWVQIQQRDFALGEKEWAGVLFGHERTSMR